MPFGERLRAARAIAGLSLQELADKIGNTVTKQAISKYERGDMKPEKLVDAGSFLSCPQRSGRLFFQGFCPADHHLAFSTPVESINQSPEVSQGNSARSARQVRRTGESPRHQDNLPKPFQGWGTQIPGRRRACCDEAAQRVGARTRPTCRQRDRPSRVQGSSNSSWWNPAVNQTRFDGLSGCRGDVPFITLLDHATADRIRFTLLHELAHVLLWPTEHEDNKGDEKLCHLFASEFLLPASVLKKEFPGSDRRTLAMPELLNVKAKFGISMQAILYRARDLGILSISGYGAIMRQFGSLGWRTSEPGDCPCSERPMQFEQLLFRAIAQDAISLSKAATLSGKSIDEIKAQLRGRPAISDH